MTAMQTGAYRRAAELESGVEVAAVELSASFAVLKLLTDQQPPAPTS